MFQPAAWSLY